MKISYREIEPFVKKPNPAARVILVYGPDHGLMRERAKTMGQSVVADINDPFNVAVFSSDRLVEDAARLGDEANAVSMMGGDRLIRVEDAGDKLTPQIKTYLENPSPHTLVILEAGELGPRSSLRLLCEKAKNAAALPCYVEDERDLTRLIRDMLDEHNLTVQPDATNWLASNIAGNRQRARAEIEKLITYMGQEASQVTLEDAMAACGEAGAKNFDDLVYAVAGRRSEVALRAYDQLLGEGVAFVAILRALQNHFRKLHLTRARIEEGLDLEQAVKKLAPPIFFKQEPAFKAQLGSWSLPALSQILSRLNALEAQCKTTGMPVETLCSQAILGISKSR